MGHAICACVLPANAMLQLRRQTQEKKTSKRIFILASGVQKKSYFETLVFSISNNSVVRSVTLGIGSEILFGGRYNSASDCFRAFDSDD